MATSAPLSIRRLSFVLQQAVEMVDRGPVGIGMDVVGDQRECQPQGSHQLRDASGERQVG